MADKKVVAAGKSPEEVAYEVMMLLLHSNDGPGHEMTRRDILNHYKAAALVVRNGYPSEAEKYFTS